ncbi:MAG: mandelate racemase/muconate lactonizing enzyme family protein [Anaerolineae bacterium]|nr:mandelate racemase/muconate lactonizing enzyme family protein [Anaerolineae bacterium]
MKITAIKAYPLGCQLEEPFGYSQRWFQGRSGLLVQVSTDEGIAGWGEVFCHDGWPAVVALLEQVYAPLILGRDPLAREAIWEQLYNWTRDYGQKGLTIAALSGVDIALWDILGKAAGLPVYRLLGGERERIQAYATGLYRTRRSMAAPSVLAEEASLYVAQGFRAVKLKVGFGVETDLRNVQTVRQAIGDDVRLMVDANHAYDAATAIALGRAIEGYDIGWFEEPVVPENVAGYCAVRRALDIPIAGGEAEFTRYGFRDLIAQGGLDIAQPDLCITGGISEGLRIAALCQAWHVRCLPHVWGTGIALATSLHFMAALPDQPSSLNPQPMMLEMDRTENPVRDQILATPIQIEEGHALVPQRPGLGVEVDPDALARYSR